MDSGKTKIDVCVSRARQWASVELVGGSQCNYAGSIDGIDNLEFDLPSKPYIRILIGADDYNVTTAKHVESVLRNKYKPEGLFIEVDVQDTVDDLSLSGKTENVTDLKAQQDLLKQYFAKRPTVSEQEVDEVLRIALKNELKKIKWTEVDNLSKTKKEDKSQASIQ